MRLTLSLMVVLTALWSTPARAPPAQTSSVRPAGCEGVTQTYRELEGRIEAERARLREMTGPTPAEGDEPAPTDRRVKAQQDLLLRLVFEQACVREDYEPDPVLVRGPTAQPPAWITSTTYYATNRMRSAGAGRTKYGPSRAMALEWGRVEVSIPTLRRPGELSLPLTLWRFELQADPRQHFILKSVTPLPASAARTEIRTKLQGLNRKSVLLFVHGFNVTFDGAALRTAQLAHDLDFPGLAVFYSWPALGAPEGYARDEEMAQLSIGSMRTVLSELQAMGATDVTLVAHSMGNRVVTEALREQVLARASMPSLKALLLAAPDINGDVFRERLAPAIASLPGITRTIYASNSDAALRASQVIHNAKRVGETSGGVLVFAGFDTVDASRAAPVLRGYGHSYVVDSAPVIGDMQDLIAQRLPPGRRGLESRGAPPNISWSLR